MQQQYIYGVHSVKSALINNSQNVIELLVLENRHDKPLSELIDLAKQAKIKIHFVARQDLDKRLPNKNHQGTIAKITVQAKYHEQDLQELLNETPDALLLILDGVQDPHNLGACIRSANAAGVTAVIVPKDNAVGLTDVVRKVASGAAEVTPVIQVTNLARTIRALKDQGVWVYGAAAEAEINIYNAQFSGKTALALGAEGKGLRRLTKELCDYLISIPMSGMVSSLNVSVAAGVCLFEVVRQRKNYSV